VASGRGGGRRKFVGLVLTVAMMLGLVSFQAFLTMRRPSERSPSWTAWHAPEFGPHAAHRAPRNGAPSSVYRAIETLHRGASAESRPSEQAFYPSPGWLALDLAYRSLAEGDLAAAERAFERALALGHEPQRAALELGWLAKARGDAGPARRLFAEAARGPDAALADHARADLQAAWLEEAWARRAAGDLAGAREALRAAASAGAAHDRIAAELALLDGPAGAPHDGAPHDGSAAGTGGTAPLLGAPSAPSLLAAGATTSGAAASGAARPLGASAAAGGSVPAAVPRDARLVGVDLYAEAVGWSRLTGPAATSELVPTFRLRALRRLPLEQDVSVYGFAQVTRELGSIEVRGGSPVLHADDAALVGAGALLRLLGGRAGLFAQAGSAVATAPGRAGEVRLDVRAGGFLAAETPRCWPAPADGLRVRVDPCTELYAEAVYVSRFDHDVLALARGRTGATLLAAGPVALGVVAEARAAADRQGDWYDNLGEVSGGLRARLLAPFRLDLTATATTGRYLGRTGRDPAPADLGYRDLRVLAATFVEF
jgi:hypothetical protein